MHIELYNNKLLNKLAVVALFVNIAFLLLYVFYDYRGLFHSDGAAKVLIAREIFDTLNFFPAEWSYVNGDLFVIFGHLLILPLLTFLSAGFLVHAISGAIFSLLILHSIWLVTGLATLPVWRRIAVVAVIASGISGFMAENLFGQVSYGVVVFFCCHLVYYSSRYINSEGVPNKKWVILLAGLLLLAYWANPKRAFVTYSLPLISALVWLLLSTTGSDRRKLLDVIGFSLVGAAAGGALHTATITKVNNVLGAANAQWLPYELILRNIKLSLKGIYAQLGGLPQAEVSLFTEVGLYAGLRFAVASLVIVMVPITIRRGTNSQNGKPKLLVLFAAFSLLFALFLQTTTSMPDMSDPIQSSRYLVPGVILCLIVLMMSEIDGSRPPVWALSIATVMAILGTGAYNTYRLSGLNSERVLAQSSGLNPERQQLIQLLAKNNLQYGYASYWNASVLSVLTDEKIRVRQIHIQNGMPVPMRHLSSNRWYHPAMWNGKTFLLLHDREAGLIDWRKMSQMGASPAEQHRYNGFVVFVFNENLARLLPGWDTRHEIPRNYLPSEGVLSQTGRLVKNDTDLGSVLIAEKGESGALHYGPYVDVDAGRYRATFDLTAERQSAPVVRIDVAAAPDQKVFGELLLDGSDKPQEIFFSLSEKRTMEFRVWALGGGRVVFRGVSLERIDKQDEAQLR